MTSNQHDAAPDAWGIHGSWVDAHDEIQQVSDDSIALLRELIGTPPADLDDTAPIVTRPGNAWDLGPVEVDCEDGVRRPLADSVPAAFPLGYHTLANGRRLIVSPGRCWLPDDWRAWGWTAQLYAARSEQSWGVGDLNGLRHLAEWSAGVGAGFVLINPLHAVAPTFPQEASPYLPASRRFRNPVYLCIDDVPGADAIDLSEFRSHGRALNTEAQIDRDASWRLKREALRAIFAAWLDAVDAGTGDDFGAWRRDLGQPVDDFATWMAIALEHGADWRTWPAELRDPRSDETAAFADQHRDEVDFQVWLQWLLDLQLRSASTHLKIIQDLPIGVDGGGADAWAWQDVLATDATVGAPPDLFNSHGQNWGSPPLVPWRLRAADYEPFITSIRATMANAGGLRVDHVMGLFRIWWVPPGGVAAEGAYVRYPSDDLLDIVALESHRQEALVVGEDLGTVEDGVREALAERAVLSYRLLWFEEDDPSDWPESAMAAITTHDLPTIAGLWSGADLDDQLEYSAETRETLVSQRETLLKPLRDYTGVDDSATAAEAVIGAHQALGRAPSLLLSASLDDAVSARLRPNMPSAPERGNWCIPLPVTIEDLSSNSTANQVADVLNAALATDE